MADDEQSSGLANAIKDHSQSWTFTGEFSKPAVKPSARNRAGMTGNAFENKPISLCIRCVHPQSAHARAQEYVLLSNFRLQSFVNARKQLPFPL